MQQQNIINVLLYGMSQQHTSNEIYTNNRFISEIVEDWNQNKYVFPDDKIKFQRIKNVKYRLM